MPQRIAKTSLNASTIDILNTIRANAPLAYQNSVPVITQESQVVQVGDIICGNPSLSNIFINSLVNRIALVRMTSALFNNPYAELKKGEILYGETIEEIFVEIAKVQKFSYEKAPAREFKRTIPDVKSVFHAINWRVIYPVSIDDMELERAFLSINGVQELIAKIVDSVYRGAEYDEFLLFKYLLIKKCANAKILPVAVDDSSILNSAEAFRAYSNKLTFMSTEYNEYGVHTNTPRERQYLFMDADFNAKFDVNVLASAFNMDKADFLGHIKLIDSFSTFDNDRWEEIRAESDGVESVTDAELNLMKNIHAILVDEDFFQIYDYRQKFTEKYVGSGTYWNYWLHVRKAVSYSPFANAIAFVSDDVTILPDNGYLSLDVVGVSRLNGANTDSVPTSITLGNLKTSADGTTYTALDAPFEMLQTETATEEGYGISPFGNIVYNGALTNGLSSTLVLEVKYNGNIYRRSASQATPSVGSALVFTKVV